MLSQTTSFLRNLDNGAEIYLVGTAHVSKNSVVETREMIQLVKPDYVMVELCPQRAHRLRSGNFPNDFEFLKESFSSLFSPNTNLDIGQQFFKFSIQGFYRMLRSFGLDPGGEFKAAMEIAEHQGAQLICGDRDVQETMKRIASTVNIQDILKMVLMPGADGRHGNVPSPPQALIDFFEDQSSSSSSSSKTSQFEARVEAMKTREMARQMSSFLRQLNPALAAALIDERDVIMTKNLRQLSGKVVGIVGIAHMDGIERLWNEKDGFDGQYARDKIMKSGTALP